MEVAETPHKTFWKPQKQEKTKKTSSLGQRKKEKKEVSPLKQKIFADHKPGKSSASRAEFPPNIVKELIKETDGICQQCLSAPGTTTHHVWPRGRKGRGVKTNGIRFCGGCHDIVQITPELLQYWIDVFRERHGEYFWFDEQDWNEHNHKLNKQLELEKAKEERLQQIEPIADLIATAAGRDLRVKEIRLLESFETNDLKIFTAMFTDALNGYAAQGSYHPNDRFED
ncbi:HNH endonuclease [Paenibacillus sp. FSL L8-0708]|uniref:HNH endonuclease n=1 Tax=Paenibacillus sp. FSL L8-0708 TaxID=2975311 RepID=UPI0030FD1B3B